MTLGSSSGCILLHFLKGKKEAAVGAVFYAFIFLLGGARRRSPAFLSPWSAARGVHPSGYTRTALVAGATGRRGCG
jgi:hypothetical protein